MTRRDCSISKPYGITIASKLTIVCKLLPLVPRQQQATLKVSAQVWRRPSKLHFCRAWLLTVAASPAYCDFTMTAVLTANREPAFLTAVCVVSYTHWSHGRSKLILRGYHTSLVTQSEGAAGLDPSHMPRRCHTKLNELVQTYIRS